MDMYSDVPPLPPGSDARPRRTVLLVCAEPLLSELISTHLRASGCFPIAVACSAEAGRLAAQVVPDLVVMDLDADAPVDADWLQKLKQANPGKPIHTLMLCSEPAAAQLEGESTSGAGVRMVKPIDPRRLMKEVLRLLRRPARAGTRSGRVVRPLRSTALELDRQRPLVRLRRADAWLSFDLPWTEHRLLAFLLSADGEPKSREAIRDAVWPDMPVDVRTVDQYVHRLRRSLKSAGAPDFVRTVIGFGYRVQREKLGAPPGQGKAGQ